MRFNRTAAILLAALTLYSVLLCLIHGCIVDLTLSRRGQFAYQERLYGNQKVMVNIAEKHLFLDYSGKLGDGSQLDRHYLQVLGRNPTAQMRTATRGFYWHHYASWASSVEGSPVKSILSSFTNQYGILGTASVGIANFFSMRINPLGFATWSLGQIAFLPILTCIYFRICGICSQRVLSTCLLIACGLSIIYMGLLNIDQLVLSPGFSVSRYIASSGIAAILFIDSDDKWRALANRASKGRRTALFASLGLLNGAEFNILLTTSSLIVFVYLVIAGKRGDATGKKSFPYLKYVIILAITSACQISLKVICDGNRALYGSASEGNLNSFALLLLIISIWLCTRTTLQGSFLAALVGSRFAALIPLMGLPMYTYAFWGSPNHAASLIILGLPTFTLCLSELGLTTEGSFSRRPG